MRGIHSPRKLLGVVPRAYIHHVLLFQQLIELKQPKENPTLPAVQGTKIIKEIQLIKARFRSSIEEVVKMRLCWCRFNSLS